MPSSPSGSTPPTNGSSSGPASRPATSPPTARPRRRWRPRRRARRSPRPGSTPREIGLIVLATATPDQTFPASATLGPDRVRHRRLHRLRRPGGLHRLPLRAVDRRQYAQGRHGRSCAGDRLGDVQPDPRLGGPGDLRPVRRRRRRGRARRPRRASDKGILATRLHADGRHNDLLYVDGGVSTTGTVGKLRMKGKEVFRHAVTNLAAVLGETLEAAGHRRRRGRLGGAAPGQQAHPRRDREEARPRSRPR